MGATTAMSATSTYIFSHFTPSNNNATSTISPHFFLSHHKSLTSLKIYINLSSNLLQTSHNLSLKQFICRAAAEYKFPDPIPEFADHETDKFKAHLVKKLSKKEDLFGDDLDEVVGICTEIFSTFLHTEYGGPGTLLVTPFIDMADTVNERELPGGPQAARAAVKWAQAHVDSDWNEWTSGNK